MEVFVTCITGEQTKETVFFFFAILQSEFESEDAEVWTELEVSPLEVSPAPVD